MENAARALLIIGTLLISLIIIAALTFMYRDITAVKRQESENEKTASVEQFNKSYESYVKNDLYGKQLISLAYKINDYNVSINTGNYNNNKTIFNQNEQIGKDGYYYILFKVNYPGTSAKPIKYYLEMQEFMDTYFGKTRKDKTVGFDSTEEIETLKNLFERIEEYKDYTDSKEYKVANDLIKEYIKKTQEKPGTTSDISNLKSKVKEIYEDGKRIKNYTFRYDDYKKFTEQKFKCTEKEYAPNGRIKSLVFEPQL